MSDLVGRMQARENDYQDQILRLMQQVADFESFEHLARLDDGAEKVQRAKAAVKALKDWIAPHRKQMEDLAAAEERLRERRDADLGAQAFQARLDELRAQFYSLHSGSNTPQERGLILESLLRDLFELFDLDPRRSFKLNGEQIDGAFTYEGTDYLVEARWTKDKIQPKHIRDFSGKVHEKLDNTLGVFISINGFTENAETMNLGSGGRPNVILITGADLNAVLEGRIDLVQLLLRKRRHAAHTGEINLPVSRILTED
ncbi:restriction endonuclease [Actinomycetospora sp. CA-053990]|uniref:restriction endonuclease n=1 Tax=Actinomycetospora sp. CA-053990 TaxID=3239891 RepID=UPI003D90E541